MIIQEIIGSNAISPAEYTGIGAVLEFDYPTQILKHFNESGGLQYLQVILSSTQPCYAVTPGSQLN